MYPIKLDRIEEENAETSNVGKLVLIFWFLMSRFQRSSNDGRAV